MSLLRLFFFFFKIGAILLGGGYVILPIVQNEFSEKRNLLSKEELVNYFGLSQSLPGIVAANISMFIGYKLRGKSGALIGMLGIIFAPFWSIVLLASVLGMFVNNSYIQGIFWGVGIAVVALIMLTVREIWKKKKKDWFFYCILSVSLLLLILFKLSPIQTIIIMAATGVIIKTIQRRIAK